MYFVDYHMHSLCSPDGEAPLTAMAQAALDAGMKELCLTDHCDLITWDGKPDTSFDWAPVEEQMAIARPQFEGKLILRMGLELGEGWDDPEFAHKIASNPEADFIIGSVHNRSRKCGGMDYYFLNYENEDVCMEALDDYITCMDALSRLDSFDVLAHIIYPLRYMNGRDGNHATLEPLYPRLRDVFKRVIDTDRGIEVNTCRGTTIEDWRPVLELYRECGGRLLTIGSDAHCPQDVAKGIPEAAALIQSYGFRSIATFDHRKPKFVDLA